MAQISCPSFQWKLTKLLSKEVSKFELHSLQLNEKRDEKELNIKNEVDFRFHDLK